MERDKFVWVKWGVPLVVGGLGLVLLAVGIQDGQKQLRMKREGIACEGRVVSFVGLGKGDLRHGKGSRVYPVVEFRAPDGRTLRFQDGDDVGESAYKAGEAVKVTYVPGNPPVTKIGGLDTGFISFIWGGVLFILLAVGIFSVAGEMQRLGLVVQGLLYFLVGGTAWMLVQAGGTWESWIARAPSVILVAAGLLSLSRSFFHLPAGEQPDGTSAAGMALKSVSDIGKETWSHIYLGAWVSGVMGLATMMVLASKEPEPIAVLIVAGFCLIGIILIVLGVRSLSFRRYHGSPTLVLKEPQIDAGDSFRADLCRAGKKTELRNGTATVRCVDRYRHVISTSNNRTRAEMSDQVAWEKAHPFMAPSGEVRVAIDGETRAGVPRSEGPDGASFKERTWRLVVKAESDGPDFEAEFVLPIREPEV